MFQASNSRRPACPAVNLTAVCEVLSLTKGASWNFHQLMQLDLDQHNTGNQRRRRARRRFVRPCGVELDDNSQQVRSGIASLSLIACYYILESSSTHTFSLSPCQTVIESENLRILPSFCLQSGTWRALSTREQLAVLPAPHLILGASLNYRNGDSD
jgi:hypothetical protein